MKKLLPLITILSLIFVATAALASQPRLIDDAKFITIENPDISQAFYGELNEWPTNYTLYLDQQQELFVQILVPAIEDIDKDVSVKIFENGIKPPKEIAELDGRAFEWTEKYDEYAGDKYWAGPEFKRVLPSGSYNIRVYSKDNYGKYVLVVGQKDELTPKGVANTLLSLPKIKTFHEKDWYEAYFNVTGLYMAGAIIVFFIMIIILLKILRIIKKLFTGELFKKKVKDLPDVVKKAPNKIKPAPIPPVKDDTMSS